MTEAPRKRATIDIVLPILLVLALIGLVIDLIDGYWTKTFSSLFLVIGLGACIQWRRYRSRRWRTIAWISFTLAFAALVLRFGSWSGFTGS